MTTTTASETSSENKIPPPARSRRRFPFIIGAAVLVVIVGAVLYYFFFVAPYESTDDAFIDGHAIAIAPQVAGRVARLLVNDNQEVRKGELLLEIDPRDYETKLAQAQANLAAARSRLEEAKAQLALGIDSSLLSLPVNYCFHDFTLGAQNGEVCSLPDAQRSAIS